ncbi:hypothetical protein N0V90_013543 [Kalmusia sp. IMI 367209]|nr:hypothetical protein N0V90_013543 [Kalmusia sp. IMI 367209]
MALYKIHALHDPDAIRVVTLHPGETNAMIEISMGVVRLSNKPKFIALSYTWGNPTDELSPPYQQYELVEHHISCGQELLAVQQNLYQALWQLREKQVYTPIWIDAICIDQINKEELNHQLSLMSRIYCDATWVLVWLGKEDATTQEAAQALGELKRTGSLVIRSMSHYEAATKSLGSIAPQSGHALAALLRRKWFNRVWTLQEALLPARMRCFCGPHEFDIGAIAMLAALLLGNASSSRGSSKLPKEFDELPLCQISGAACIAAWQGLTWSGGGFGSRAVLRYPKIDSKMEIPRTFKWLVALELHAHEARQRNCTQLKDKILAPLAFALNERFTLETPDFVALKREAHGILDCRLPVSELYLKFTRFLIDSMSNLDILSRAHRENLHEDPTKALNLPSWVPPFHEVGTTSLVDDLFFSQYKTATYLGPYCQIEGSLANASELRVRAVFFGRIVQISNHAAPADTLITWFSHLRNSSLYRQETELGNDHDLAHIVLHQIEDRLADAMEWETERQKHREKLLNWYFSAITLIQLNTPVSPRRMRKLFRFDVNGQRLIGLAPTQAQESDHICIMQGASVPFIVRESSEKGKYTLVGEAFAENFMHGEVQSLDFADKDPVEDTDNRSGTENGTLQTFGPHIPSNK